MIELTVLSGPQYGRRIEAASLPCRFGKSAALACQFSGPGVWDEHFEVTVQASGQIVVLVLGDARVWVDSTPVREVNVRDGLILEAGGTRVRLGIQPAGHGSLLVREALFWVLFGLLVLVQGCAIWWIGR
jgi:hypothetical protein